MENNELENIYKYEIAQRNSIKNKIRNKIKISHDERKWLVTHSVYNTKFGIDTFNVVIEKVEPNKWLSVKINIESVKYESRIIPIIYTPTSKGIIATDLTLSDQNGRQKENKQVKMLGIEINNIIDEYEVDYYSDLGLLSVQYECDYFDVKQNLNKRESSSTGNPDFAMKREVLDNCTIRYRCKSPIADTFDALVFRVRWNVKGS